MTDSELRQAFKTLAKAASGGFANPQHLDKLLKRSDLPPDREISVRSHLSQAVNSARIQPGALQRFSRSASKSAN